MIERFTKRPVTIKAIQYTGTPESNREIIDWTRDTETPAHLDKSQDDPERLLINTLEGTHTVSVGDYVIRGVKGEHYACKPDIFVATYTNGRGFGWAIEMLEQGYTLRREGWNGKGMFVVKQIPATIGLDIIPKMQSLPQAAKDEMLMRGQSIAYTNQMLIVNAEGRADSWVPSSSDVFAKDWEVAS